MGTFRFQLFRIATVVSGATCLTAEGPIVGRTNPARHVPLRIQNAASRTRRVGIGLRPGRLSETLSSGKCSRIRFHCPSRSFNTHTIQWHYIDVRSAFELGSSLLKEYATLR